MESLPFMNLAESNKGFGKSNKYGKFMQIIIGWILIIFGSLLYLAQVISSINFSLAQRLGIQEKPEISDPLLQRSERYTAYWDLITLIWLPVAGVLMITDHHWWPIISLIAGAIYLDTAGREAVKILSFRHEGLKMGTPKEQKVYFASYIIMAFIAVAIIIYSIIPLIELL